MRDTLLSARDHHGGIATTVLVAMHAFGLDWAGYIVGAIAAVIGVIPLLGGG